MHEDTNYDSLLMAGVPRDVAREQIKGAIEQVLGGWAWHPSRYKPDAGQCPMRKPAGNGSSGSSR